jgi:hypothetical protein
MELLINTLVDNVHNITEKRRPTERSPWAFKTIFKHEIKDEKEDPRNAVRGL